MRTTIRVRDVVCAQVFEVGPDERVLRVPYDLFRPDGPVRVRRELAEWLEGGVVKTGRVAATRLAETTPGERVLFRRMSSISQGDSSDDEWWLCEIEDVVGGARRP
jgi:hypothetical protein